MFLQEQGNVPQGCWESDHGPQCRTGLLPTELGQQSPTQHPGAAASPRSTSTPLPSQHASCCGQSPRLEDGRNNFRCLIATLKAAKKKIIIFPCRTPGEALKHKIKDSTSPHQFLSLSSSSSHPPAQEQGRRGHIPAWKCPTQHHRHTTTLHRPGAGRPISLGTVQCACSPHWSLNLHCVP